ncbi:hypothetical protein M426DRAFT_132003 [Hypoxylon sp. CI-4A]|nr:hypothetical protein M426DRAFT_132003 [Hypoxylon sp. CI-4A]
MRIGPIGFSSNVNEIRPGFGYLAPLDFTKAHKRATSAPNFTAIDTADRPYPPLPAFPQSTSSPAHRGESQPSYTMEAASPLAPMPSVRDDRIKCMYKENCDTGSQLRKAISHIFGRNKTCTRNIPPHVWVHFCRKHYQRSRYRNAHEWARVQCDLVQTQIQRVQEWSDENKKDGKPGIVQDWSLSMRKREQNRVQERSNRKRPYRDDSDDDGDSIPDNAILNGTAVPDWLRSKCADGYSTTEIQAIIARLKKEMEDTRMTQIPDIEILPNISMDTSNDARARPAMKRVTMARNNTHKKSHSVGVALGPESHSMARRTSQPSQLGYEDATRPSPSEKRQRMSHTSPYSDRIAQSNPKPSESSAQRSDLAPLRDMYPLPHRPAFGNIQESRAEDSYYGRENAGASSHNYGSWPAPTTQRHGSQSTVATLESNVARDYPSDRRNTHQRSFSDADNFQNGFAFRAPIGYPPNHVPEATAYGRGSMHPGRPHTPPTLAGYYDSYPAPAPRSFGAYQSSWPSPSSNHALAYPGHRHMRHQSTPSAPQTSAPQAPNVEYEYASGARTGATFEQSPQYHPRQRPYAPPRLYPNRIIESDQAKNIYSERR